MAFDIVKAFQDQAWLDGMAEKLDDKMQYAVSRAREVDFIPYTTVNGELKPTAIGWWTNGFWPASMWQMFRMTGKEIFWEEALRTEKNAGCDADQLQAAGSRHGLHVADSVRRAICAGKE